MKSLSISLFNRFEYTKTLFEYLAKCINIEDYKIIISCEPVDYMVEFAKEFLPNQTTVYKNNVILGCQANIFMSIERGFSLGGNFHIHLEDDTIPGKDFLQYCEWANRKFEKDQEIFSVSGYVNSNNKMKNCWDVKTDNINLTGKRKHFTPWGWGIWRDRWQEVKAGWDFGYNNGGWDVNMANNLRKDRYEIYPKISRIQNIGALNGVHVKDAEWHNRNHYNEYWIETIGKYSNDYSL